jgi:hypothetical protein
MYIRRVFICLFVVYLPSLSLLEDVASSDYAIASNDSENVWKELAVT